MPSYSKWSRFFRLFDYNSACAVLFCYIFLAHPVISRSIKYQILMMMLIIIIIIIIVVKSTNHEPSHYAVKIVISTATVWELIQDWGETS
jgi:hypothetical protein